MCPRSDAIAGKPGEGAEEILVMRTGEYIQMIYNL